MTESAPTGDTILDLDAYERLEQFQKAAARLWQAAAANERLVARAQAAEAEVVRLLDDDETERLRDTLAAAEAKLAAIPDEI